MTSTTNWTTPEKGDTILVTGGAGFLGQHIISLLQTRAENIKEIRVLDLKQYENKLGKHILPICFKGITTLALYYLA